jgi:uncharacterized membrane protein
MHAIYQYALAFLKFLTHTLTVIHSVLTLTMQNGAFLHLVVTLAAIVARLAHLSTSLRRALSSLHAECLHLFDKLYVCGEQSVVHQIKADEAGVFFFFFSVSADRSYAQLELKASATATTTRRG